jgi:hypothetical protein
MLTTVLYTRILDTVQREVIAVSIAGREQQAPEGQTQ